jgi:hypothetical protein
LIRPMYGVGYVSINTLRSYFSQWHAPPSSD